MIDDPFPSDWRQLQHGVHRLFSEIGLAAEIEKTLRTPRGQVVVDVYAVDESSVDKIRYVVECKNWKEPIPQSVVHSFTTVMHETGANLGFIVSQHGLQSGALAYTENTNIKGLTYLDLQRRYLPVWWEKYFCLIVGDVADELLLYVEPVNGERSRKLRSMSSDANRAWQSLVDKYVALGMTLGMFNMGRVQNLRGEASPVLKLLVTTPADLETFRSQMLDVICPFHTFRSTTFRDLLDEIRAVIAEALDEFHKLFGENILRDTPRCA